MVFDAQHPANDPFDQDNVDVERVDASAQALLHLLVWNAGAYAGGREVAARLAQRRRCRPATSSEPGALAV